MSSTKFNFKHYLKFFLGSFKISFKQVTEYKGNFYSTLIIFFIFNIIYLFFMYILYSFTADITGWELYQYILFMYLYDLVADISGLFWYGESLARFIKEGDFNSYLSKPGNPFIIYTLKPKFNPILFIILDGVVFIPYFIYVADWSILNVLLGILGVLLLAFSSVIVVSFFSSFSWRFIELGDFLRDKIYWRTLFRIYNQFPMNLFEKAGTIKLSFSILPLYFISTLLIPIFSGLPIRISMFELTISIIVIIICAIWTYFNWSYGIKHYEAFS